MIDQFLQNTFTKQQATLRLALLKNHLNKTLFHGEQEIQMSQEENQWLTALGESFYQQFNATNLDQMLTNLEDQLKNVPVLTVYIAFDMPDQEKNKLGSYLRQNFNPQVIFETRVDPSVIAGCALSWKGVYKDYSLKSKVEQEKSQIVSIFKSFMK